MKRLLMWVGGIMVWKLSIAAITCRLLILLEPGLILQADQGAEQESSLIIEAAPGAPQTVLQQSVSPRTPP